jgi:uncharacterized protein (DUF111 family)
MKKGVKITKPLHKTSLKNIEDILKEFEIELSLKDSDLNVYTLAIKGNYPVNLLDEVAVAYKEAGWADAVCFNIQESGIAVLKLTAVHLNEK